MIKLRTILLWAIALLMISTVTIFDPQDITENVLSKLVPERKTQQDTNVTVRLKLDKPVLPGQTAVDVKDVKDAAGNPVPVRTKAAIKSDDTTAPRIVSVVAMSRPGGKDLVLVCFEKRVLPEDAAVAANYDLECPAGSKVFGPKVKYDTESFASTLELGLGRLKVGAKWALRAKNIRDIAGNRISEDAVVEGVVQEYQPLPEVLLAIQDTALAPSGRMVEVVFNGKLDAATAKDAGNYKTSDGRLPETCELLPGGRTVVLTFEQPVTPGETQLHIRSLRDTRGNLLPHIPAQSIVAVEADEPRIVKAAAEAVAGATNDTVAVTFSEPMTPQDAATLGNFTIEASYEPLKGLSPEEQLAVAASALPLAAVPGPVGHIAPLTSFLLSPKATALDLADSKVAYDATTRTTTITLNKPNLRPDATFKVAVSNVRDVSGNAMAAKGVAQGIVGGDKSEPTVAKVLQNIYEDSTGATVDIKFSEAVTASSVEVLGNYVAAGGPTTGGRASAALIAKQQKDKETVRVVFDR
ncbi:MAG: hypothetical protein FJ279_29910, partial [Planctomycetes bacterium]|nr:hypothetical protein [Planctomycetota bacterium]